MNRPAVQVNPAAVLAVVALAQVMVILDVTVVNVALPTIKRELGFSEQSLSWILNAYTLMFGGFLLLGGRAADRLGRRRLFMAGISLFSGASLISGLSQSGGMLLVARGAQGLGGAMLSPAALSIILTTFAEGPERNRALAVWGCDRGRWWRCRLVAWRRHRSDDRLAMGFLHQRANRCACVGAESANRAAEPFAGSHARRIRC